jgi:N-acetylglucosamine-6-phosphate deacetylase
MSEYIAYVNGIVHDGTSTLHEHAVVCHQRGLIRGVIPIRELSKNIRQIDLQGNHLAPSFIDLQIYGAANQLFSAYPTLDTLMKTSAHCRAGGGIHFLITIATNSWDVVDQAIEAGHAYLKKGNSGFLGLHLEGPFINPLKKGAHVASFIEKPTLKRIKKLLEKGKNIILMMTIAPECCSDDVIELLKEHHITLSAGHSNATYEEAMLAFDRGFSSVTHLYNAMSGLHHRSPGLVSAAFNHHSVTASIVADGHHVDWAAIKIAKKLMEERLYLITDAVTGNDKGEYVHQLNGDKYVLPDGTLSGSALTMMGAVKNVVKHCDIELDEALRMASLYPAQVIGIETAQGRIEKGFDGNLVVFDNDLNLIKTIDRHV